RRWREASFYGRRRGGVPCPNDRNTTPSSRKTDAAQYFLDRSATPPRGDARRGITPFHFCSHLLRLVTRAARRTLGRPWGRAGRVSSKQRLRSAKQWTQQQKRAVHVRLRDLPSLPEAHAADS